MTQATKLGVGLLASVAFLSLSQAEERPPAPAFTLPNMQGQPISSEGYVNAMLVSSLGPALMLLAVFILSPDSSYGDSGSTAFQARDVVKRGTLEVGVLTGYHQAQAVLTSDSGNRSAVHVLPRMGMVLTDELGGGLFSGNIELLAELLYAHHVKPFSAEAGGGSLGLKYNLLSFGRWMPYWSVGAGMLWTNLAPRIFEQSTPFNFVLRSGPGIQYFLTDRVVPTFDAAFYHVSNAGIGDRNRGLNSVFISIGLSIMFPN